MTETILNSAMSGFEMICLKLVYEMFAGLMGLSILLLLCITTIPFFILKVLVGSDTIFQEYKTITANFNEQRAANN